MALLTLASDLVSRIIVSFLLFMSSWNPNFGVWMHLEIAEYSILLLGRCELGLDL